MDRVLLRWMASTVTLAFVLGCGLEVRADDLVAPSVLAPVGSPNEPSQPSPHYLRAVLEDGAILIAGAVQYSTATSNSVDWDLGYDWPSFRSKLTGQSVRFDTNHFDTNMVTHPIAGTLYYIAARGNRLTVVESFLFATAASTLWEYVGEFREMVSINDLIVTPISGLVFGEMLTRFGIFLKRGRPSVVTDLLGSVLAPSTTIHDFIDGHPTARDQDVDGLGLTRAVGHRFELRLGVGAVETADKSRLVDARFALDTEVIDIAHFNAPGRRSMALFDTSDSRLRAEAAVSGRGLRDFQLDALVAPIAYYAQDLRREGRELVGDRFFVGATVGFDYGVHSYVTAPYVAGPLRDSDQIAGVHAAGVTAEYSKKGQALRVRVMLDVRPEFAAVHSLARSDYAARGGDLLRVPTVMAAEGYYFAVGAVVAPTVEVGLDHWTLGAQARLESYVGIEGLDRRQEEIHNQVEVRDQRTLGRVYLSYAAVDALAAGIGVERRGREGEVADIATKRTEWALTTTVGVSF